MRNKETRKIFNLIQINLLLSIFLVGVGHVVATEEPLKKISSLKISTPLHEKLNYESDTDSTGSLSTRPSDEQRKSSSNNNKVISDEVVQSGTEQSHTNQAMQKGVTQVEKKLTLKERINIRYAEIQAKNRIEAAEKREQAKQWNEQFQAAINNAEIITINYDSAGHEIGRTLRVAPGSLPPSKLPSMTENR